MYGTINYIYKLIQQNFIRHPQDPIKALENFEKAHALKPNNFEIIYKTALAYYKSKNYPMAIEFFNKAAPLTTRMHQLELLPGLGKKHMWEIIEERKDKPFESSFPDFKVILS